MSQYYWPGDQVNLGRILIKLKGIESNWRSLAEAVGVERLEFVRYKNLADSIRDVSNPDAEVGLDQILIKLKGIESNWRAEAVGVKRLEFLQVSSDSEAMKKIVDGWLSQLSPRKPAWNEMANAVESIDKNLADSIRDVSNTDAEVGLDQILIQLKGIESNWRRLAVAVGVERLEFVSSDSEAMKKVVDGWLSQLSPRKPTWNEIADAVERIDKNLADSIRDVSNTDAEVGLDQILIQLKGIESDWRRLAEAVGVKRLDKIAKLVSSDSEAMEKVVEDWLSQLSPRKPAWNEIANAGERIDKNLADFLRDVYNASIQHAKFIRAEIGWDLSTITPSKHIPKQDSQVLVMPPKFRGVVLGCALRCEGCHVKVTADVVKNLNKDVDQYEKAKKEAEEIFKEANNLKYYEATLNKHENNLRKAQKSLKDSEQDMEVAMKRIEQEIKLKCNAENLIDEVRAQKEALENVSLPLARSASAPPTFSTPLHTVVAPSSDARLHVDPQKYKNVKAELDISRSESAEHLIECRRALIAARLAAMNKRKALQKKRNDVSKQFELVKKSQNKYSLQDRLATFEVKLIKQAYWLQSLAIDKDQRQRAFELSGTRLLTALIIGFDMESEGLPSALGRIFRRVGFINFSTHFTDYENPLKVLNNSPRYFNAVAPIDAIVSERMVDIVLPLDLKDKREIVIKERMSVKVLDGLGEVWQEHYLEKKKIDDIESQKFKAGLSTVQPDKEVNKLNLLKSSYVVIGPLSNDLHRATVNAILKKYKHYLTGYALILTIKPLKVGGTRMTTFLEYNPSEYVKCKSVPPKMKMSHSVDVKTSNGAVQDSGEDSTPYKIEVEHTTVEFDIKIYRRM